MNYEKLAESVITSAVNKHLRDELRQHCAKVAKAQATSWLVKNRSKIASSIGIAVEQKLNAELKGVVAAAAKNVVVRAPVKRRYY